MPFQLSRTSRLTDNQHTELLEYLLARVRAGYAFRDRYEHRWTRIDREINSYMKNAQEDSERDRKNQKGEGVSPLQHKTDLLFGHLNESLTYISGVLAPDLDMYEAISHEEKMAAAQSFTAKMNKDAQVFDHYSQLLLAVLDALRYNFAPLYTCWEQRFGTTIQNSPAGAAGVATEEPEIKDGIIWTGNSIKALDPYNFSFDYSVPPSRLFADGEFCAWTEELTSFRLRQMFAKEQAFGMEDLAKTNYLQAPGNMTEFFKSNERDILSPHLLGGTGGSESWVKIFANGANMTVPGQDHMAAAHAITTLYIHIPGRNFGLATATERDQYRIWKFRILNQQVIIYAEEIKNAHGYLPVSIGHSLLDRTLEAMTFAERLNHIQQQESFDINAHIMETRRSVNGGLVFYDSNKIPALAGDNQDLTGGGRIPVELQGDQDDIRRHIYVADIQPSIRDLANQLGVYDQRAQRTLPSAQANQVAGLDRATQFQAAAVVQSAARSNLIIARRFDQTCFVPCRHMQHRNLLAFGEQQEIIGQDGKLTQTNPSEWRGANLEFATASGLRGLDRLAYTLNMRELLAMVTQSQQAAQQFDIVKLMNYVSQLFGDYTDFNQFRIQSPLDALTPEEKQVAFQLFQQATSGQGPETPA